MIDKPGVIYRYMYQNINKRKDKQCKIIFQYNELKNQVAIVCKAKNYNGKSINLVESLLKLLLDRHAHDKCG